MWIDTWIDRWIDRRIDKWRDTEIDRQIDSQIDRDIDIDTDTDIDRQKKNMCIYIYVYIQTQTQTQTHTQTKKQTSGYIEIDALSQRFFSLIVINSEWSQRTVVTWKLSKVMIRKHHVSWKSSSIFWETPVLVSDSYEKLAATDMSQNCVAFVVSALATEPALNY